MKHIELFRVYNTGKGIITVANKSYIVLSRYVDVQNRTSIVETVSHPYTYQKDAKKEAEELAKDNPGGVYYVASIEIKVTCPPSQPIFEYLS